MGNGVSTDQGNLPPHGTRDVRIPEDEEEQHDWSQLARAPNTNTALLVDQEAYSIVTIAIHLDDSTIVIFRIAIYRDNLQYCAPLTQQITAWLAVRSGACLV